MRPDPIGQPLGPGGFDVSVVAGPQDRDEDLRLTHLPGCPVHHRHGRARVIHQQLLAGHIMLTQHRLQGVGPLLIEGAELAVPVAVRVLGPVLLPQERQGHVLASSQFLV